MSDREVREGKDIYKKVVAQIDPDLECKINRQGGIYRIALLKGGRYIAFTVDEDFFADLPGNTRIGKDEKIKPRADSQIGAHFRWIKLCTDRLSSHN